MTVLQYDIQLYGWYVVWNFASYIADKLIKEEEKLTGPRYRLIIGLT